MLGTPAEELLREVRRRISIIETYSKNYVEYLSRGEYAKASEAVWGILSNLVSILNILHGGKPVARHDDLRKSINTLASMLRNEEVIRWYRACETLHANYYHNFMDENLFHQHRADAEKLINTLQRLVQRKLRELGIKT